jgi:16S rRNA C967 or C1407 C5-methylase (RsmB/RsmF family)
MNDLSKMAAGYEPQYGRETEDLLAGLITPSPKVALVNPFMSADAQSAIIENSQQQLGEGNLYRLTKDCAPKTVENLMSHYFLDYSSVLAPLHLPIDKGAKVLDMCAAPGGKLLIMISRMIKDAMFYGNDISKARSLRLKKVLTSFLPKELYEQRVKISTKDASYFGLHMKESFDAILLDAPCSGEAHILHNVNLRHRVVRPSKNLPFRQYSLLCSALLALKPGGHVMYATCSINKLENDGVIEKLLRKKADKSKVVKLSPPLGSINEFGVTLLPHIHGCGPAFFSLIQRI